MVKTLILSLEISYSHMNRNTETLPSNFLHSNCTDIT